MYFGRQSIIDILIEECIMYLRKSRSDDPFLSVEEVLRNHEAELDDWCMRNLGTIVPKENRYKEVVSGEKLSERPEINKVLLEIEKPNIKYIITNEPSRLSRGYLDEIGKLIKLLRYNKITVITPTKIYNMEDEYDRDLFERELKRGNEYLEYSKKIMKRGKERKIADGEFIGAFAPYGYRKYHYKEGRRTVKTLKIHQEEAEVVKMIFQWYLDGMSFNAIIHKLIDLKLPSPHGQNGHSGEWTKNAGIVEMLTNPVYIGKIRWQYRKTKQKVINQEIITSKLRTRQEEWLLFEGLHEAIIDEETFYKVQEKRKEAVPLPISRKMSNPFAGLLTCKKCGHSIILRKQKNGKHLLVCRHKPHCQASAVRYDEFEETILEVLKQSIEDFEIRLEDSNEKEVEEHNRNIALLEKRLRQLEQTEINQWEAQTSSDLSQRMPPHIFKQLNEKVLKEKSEVMDSLNNLQHSAPTKINYEPRIATFKKALEYIKDDTIEIEMKNDFLKSFIKDIVIDRNTRKRLTKEEAKKLGKAYTKNRPCYSDEPYHIEVFFKD